MQLERLKKRSHNCGRKMISLFKLSIVSLLIIASSGCRYKPGLSTSIKQYSIGISVKNNSKAIQFTAIFRRLLKDEFLLYPNIKIVDPSSSKADYLFEITLENYKVSPESYRASDSIAAASFQGALWAETNLIDLAGSTKNLNYSYVSSASSSNLANLKHVSDRQLHIALGKDLSRRISRDLIQNLL